MNCLFVILKLTLWLLFKHAVKGKTVERKRDILMSCSTQRCQPWMTFYSREFDFSQKQTFFVFHLLPSSHCMWALPSWVDPWELLLQSQGGWPEPVVWLEQLNHTVLEWDGYKARFSSHCTRYEVDWNAMAVSCTKLPQPHHLSHPALFSWSKTGLDIWERNDAPSVLQISSRWVKRSGWDFSGLFKVQSFSPFLTGDWHVQSFFQGTIFLQGLGKARQEVQQISV